MNKYIAFYKNKQIEVSANSSYEAQKEAAAQLAVHPSKRYMITVMLAEKDGQEVVHSTSRI